MVGGSAPKATMDRTIFPLLVLFAFFLIGFALGARSGYASADHQLRGANSQPVGAEPSLWQQWISSDSVHPDAPIAAAPESKAAGPSLIAGSQRSPMRKHRHHQVVAPSRPIAPAVNASEPSSKPDEALEPQSDKRNPQ